MLTELYDFMLTPADNVIVWPIEGAEPYCFPIADLLAWASYQLGSDYAANDVDDFDGEIVTTLYISDIGTEYTHPQTYAEWWAEVGAKDAMLIDYLNAEITGRRASMPAAFATESEKQQGSADGLPII